MNKQKKRGTVMRKKTNRNSNIVPKQQPNSQIITDDKLGKTDEESKEPIDAVSRFCTQGDTCKDCEEDISCFKKIAGVLSEDEIKKHNLIVNSIEKNFSPTVFVLTLGGFHYLYGNGEEKQSLTPICIGSDAEMEEENSKPGEKFVRPNGPTTNTLTIPPLGSALVQLNEIVDTYTVAEKSGILITGRFDLKLSLVNKGLISQQGTQVEPCYRGRLYCFVHNFSNKSIELEYEEPVASVEFSYVSCFCNEDKRSKIIRALMERNKKERYFEDDYCESGKGIMNVRYFRRKKTLPEECGLFSAISIAKKTANDVVIADATIEKITAKVKSKIDKKATIITALTSIVVAVIAGYFSYVKPMNDANKDYKSKIDSYQVKSDDYEKRIYDLEKKLEKLIDKTNNAENPNSNQTNP